MIAVTAATGHLGRLAVDALLRKVPAREVVAAVRNPDKAGDLAARGVQVRRADYARPETLGPALAGAEKLLLISSSEIGQRAQQHAAVVKAAKGAGVKHLAYTSLLHADVSPIGLAAEHRQTEADVRASGIPFTFLRNGWYLENYTENLAPVLQHGALLGCGGNGRVAAAARADYAEAAAAVLTSAGHEGKTYELSGDRPFTLAELAAEVARQSGKKIAYTELPPAKLREALVGAGVPAPFAELLVDWDQGIARGALDDASGDLRRLIGRPTTALADAVAAALKR